MKAASWHWNATRSKSQSEFHSHHDHMMLHSLQREPFPTAGFFPLRSVETGESL